MEEPIMAPQDDFFNAEITNYQAELNNDMDFKPLKGKYICRVDEIVHNIGFSERNQEPYDFYSLKLQVKETVEGDKGTNRYLSKKYQNNPDQMKKLKNDLFTAGIEADYSSREAFDLSLNAAKDKEVNIRAWGWTPEKKRDGTVIPVEDREAIQQFNIVKDFSKSKKQKSTDSVPF